MKSWLPFLVIGLTTGAVYAIASLGLVLTYRTSGVFNFAHGAIGMFATYVCYSLRQHMPTALAVTVAVLVVAPLMGSTPSSGAWRVRGRRRRSSPHWDCSSGCRVWPWSSTVPRHGA